MTVFQTDPPLPAGGVMGAEAQTSSTADWLRTSRPGGLRSLFYVCALVAALATANAAPRLSTDNPLEFFTNVASRLLSSEMNLDLTRIQLYPANQYTPAVHRLLQVTANLYDSTTTNSFPTIFRPLFNSDGTNVFINGYELVNAPWDTNTSYAFLSIPRDLNDDATRSAIGNAPTQMNIYGVPWIIGAKKGLPNFNQLQMQTVSQITRKLKVHKPSIAAPFSQFEYTQMYLIGISNVIGVSLWNSYLTNYPGAVYIQADGTLSMSLTNNLGPVSPPVVATVVIGGANPAPGGAISLGVAQWQGSGWVAGSLVLPKVASFQIPLFTNYVFLPDLVYRHTPSGFVVPPPNTSLVWPNAPGYYPQPQWGLNISNRIRCIIFDGGVGGRVIDYVQLGGLDSYRNLTQEFQTADTATGLNGLWSTNFVTAFGTTMPQGLINQINISDGNNPSSDIDWQSFMLSTSIGSARLQAIDSFRVFMKLSPIYFPGTVNTNLEMQLPFNPTAKRFQPLTWQVNDPLVHYLTSDLNNLVISDTVYSLIPPNSTGQLPVSYTNLSALTGRYSPWGGNPTSSKPDSPQNPKYNVAVKDPLIFTSDYWDFPSGEPLSFATIGRIHRGTSWQTIYLKSADTNGVDWPFWTGDNVIWSINNNFVSDASFSRPVRDRALISLLGPVLSTNDPSHQLSINNPGTNAWLGILDGLIVETNNPVTLSTGNAIISSNSPEAAAIVQGIFSTRANPTVFPNQTFPRLGDVLASPSLTEQSPFLNTNNLQSYSAGGLSDEVFESLPSQLLPLLREDFFGALIQTNNQSLLQFTGNDFCTYAVEASSNLMDWTILGIHSPLNGVFIFTDMTPLNTGQRFYRSVLLP